MRRPDDTIDGRSEGAVSRRAFDDITPEEWKSLLGQPEERIQAFFKQKVRDVKRRFGMDA